MPHRRFGPQWRPVAGVRSLAPVAGVRSLGL